MKNHATATLDVAEVYTLQTGEERLSLQAVAPRPGGGDGHGVLLWYSGFVCRAGYGLSLVAGAVVKDAINKYIVVGNC